jgi:tetratricopeptide (TPR) repeat protein
VALEAEAYGEAGAGRFYGAARWTDVEEHARAVLAEEERLGPKMRGALLGLAGAATAQGRFEEARAYTEDFRRHLEERGDTFGIITAGMGAAERELVARDCHRAEEAARATWEGLGAIGERGFRSTVGGHLAQALVGLGRIEDAVAILDESEALGSEDDWVTVALVRYGRALIASASGEHDSAVALARGAVSVADERETLNFRAQLWLGLGRILLAADRRDEAREAIVEALRLAELKGSTVFVDEARALLAELAPAG